MDEETYKSLKILVAGMKKIIKDKWGFYDEHSEYYREISALEGWLNETEKDFCNDCGDEISEDHNCINRK